MTTTAILFLVVMAFVMAGYSHVARKEQREISRRFDGREDLTVDQVCELFCREGFEDRPLAKELMEYVANELSVSPALLRPTDRFDVELLPPRGFEFDSAKNTLLLDLMRLAKKKGQEMKIEKIKTLGDYVRAMATMY